MAERLEVLYRISLNDCNNKFKVNSMVSETLLLNLRLVRRVGTDGLNIYSVHLHSTIVTDKSEKANHNEWPNFNVGNPRLRLVKTRFSMIWLLVVHICKKCSSTLCNSLKVSFLRKKQSWKRKNFPPGMSNNFSEATIEERRVDFQNSGKTLRTHVYLIIW